jgi:CheY-like chemotaxis protein
VALAPDGQAAPEAVAEAEGGPFDVLLTDLRMPRLAGEELVRRLRARQPGLPVVVVTGCLTPGAERVLRAAGGPLSILHKPVALDRLIAEVVRVASAGIRRVAAAHHADTGPAARGIGSAGLTIPSGEVVPELHNGSRSRGKLPCAPAAGSRDK